MNDAFWLVAAILILINVQISHGVVKIVDTPTAEKEKKRDEVGYEAIRAIHRDMDDDHSGSIDRNESTGFMKEDMHMRGSERTRRENKFHGDDDAITVDDLWEAWFESEERLWTNERLVEWLKIDVNLPSIADIAKQKQIDGRALPRFASPNSDFLSKELGIKSSVYRQKLRLNSLDIVLFGYKDMNNKAKDVLLALLALLLTSIMILFVRQRQKAQLKVLELSTRLTELKCMENEFGDMQKMLNEERNKKPPTDGSVNLREMENLRTQLEEAERRLEANSNGSGTPLALQPLLRKTCEIEMAFLEKQRQECFKEMKEAIEMVDKLQKKQGSVLSSLKLATGASSTSDQVDSKIFALKSRMEKIHTLTRETQERWAQIESLCGFSVFYTNELENISLASDSHFFGNIEIGGAKNNTASSITSRTTDQRFDKEPLIQPTALIHFTAVNDNGIDKKSPSEASSGPHSHVESPVEDVRISDVLKQDLDDNQSIATVSSNGGVKTKKKGIFPKFFRRNISKSSIGTSSS